MLARYLPWVEVLRNGCWSWSFHWLLILRPRLFQLSPHPCIHSRIPLVAVALLTVPLLIPPRSQSLLSNSPAHRSAIP
jgi:hypothetical protein